MKILKNISKGIILIAFLAAMFYGTVWTIGKNITYDCDPTAVQEISRIEKEYDQADIGQKIDLKDYILHQTANCNLESLPPKQKAFIERLRWGQE